MVQLYFVSNESGCFQLKPTLHLDSMQKLSLLDPVDVYRQLADVLEHNRQHFETHDWKRAIKWNSYD